MVTRLHVPRICTLGRFRLLTLLIVLCVSSNSAADEPVAFGPEFRIPSSTHDVDTKPRAATRADGGFVVVWESGFSSDGSSYGILGRRFNADGAAIGDDFQVNSYTSDLQVFPDIVMADSGEFVAIWQSYPGQDGDGWGIFAQRFAPDGNPMGDEIAVNPTTEGDQNDAGVTLADNGGFLVIWDHNTPTEHQIRAQRFDSMGLRTGAEHVISSPVSEDDFDPRVTLRPDGSFVAAWERTEGDGSGKAIFARLLAADGTPNGGEFQVNSFTTFDQEDPEITTTEDGSFAVTWESQVLDGSGSAVAFKIFESDGTPRTDDIQINVSTINSQVDPAIAKDGHGFLIVWHSQTGLDPEGQEVLGRRFDSSGISLGGEFVVNEIADGDQYYADVDEAANGRFIIVWTSDDCEGCFREAEGRLFDTPPFFTDGFESGDTSAWE